MLIIYVCGLTGHVSVISDNIFSILLEMHKVSFHLPLFIKAATASRCHGNHVVWLPRCWLSFKLQRLPHPNKPSDIHTADTAVLTTKRINRLAERGY